MQYKQLGQSDLNVSRICLGTMTFGNQNTEREAHQQLDYALERGINFIDTAEMYPVPSAAHHQGSTEHYIGNWMQARGNRDQVILATKATGPGDNVSYLREGLGLDRRNLEIALNNSLERLQTDYIDLYQLHWPDRATNFFGKLGYRHDPSKDGASLLESLQVLKEFVDAGKVRYIGLSNETPWGVMSALKYAELLDLPRVVTVQNPYNLLNRSLEVGLSEVLLREEVDLLAYSPLAFGHLSGKYLNGARPEGSRLQLFPFYSRYESENGVKACEAYVELAKRHGFDPAQMALAFVNSRDFMGSNIIGATTMEQLKTNIDSIDLQLSQEVLDEIEVINKRYTYPCP